jgi:hypothetical protein
MITYALFRMLILSRLVRYHFGKLMKQGLNYYLHLLKNTLVFLQAQLPFRECLAFQAMFSIQNGEEWV